MFFKKKEEKEIKSTSLIHAEEISKKYSEISNCCDLISTLNLEEDNPYYMLRSLNGGWKLPEDKIKSSGIDINLVYDYIEKLALEKKKSLECELICLTNK